MSNAHAAKVGQRIAEARENLKRQGVDASQEWLGNQVGLRQRAISNYETGKREPGLEMLGKLAKALRCNPMWLGAMDDEEGYGRREQALLELFRGTDERGRESVLRVAEAQPGMRPGDEAPAKKWSS